MATSKKILNTLEAAIKYLENSALALNKDDENLLADSVWHGVAELEYALFLFSMALPSESNFEWKPNPKLKKMETSAVLSEAEKLLRKAEELAVEGKLFDAYNNAYIARQYMFKVQEDLAKKKREALKRKQ
jgi:hypothetical protein